MLVAHSRHPFTAALRRALNDMKRHAPQMAPIHDHLEGVVARRREGDAGQPHDEVRSYRAAGRAAGDLQRSLRLEEPPPIGVVEANLHWMAPRFNERGGNPDNEDHGAVSEREFASPDRIEYTEDVQLTLLAHVGSIGYDREIDLQR